MSAINSTGREGATAHGRRDVANSLNHVRPLNTGTAGEEREPQERHVGTLRPRAQGDERSVRLTATCQRTSFTGYAVEREVTIPRGLSSVNSGAEEAPHGGRPVDDAVVGYGALAQGTAFETPSRSV